MDRFKQFVIRFGADRGMIGKIPVSREVRIDGDQNIVFRDARGQEIMLDRCEFGQVVNLAIAGGYLQIVGADLRITNTDTPIYRRRN